MGYVNDNREWLEPYVEDLKGRMGLSQWRIILSDDPPSEGCDATMNIHATYLRAYMMIDEPTEGEGKVIPEELRATIAHELTHLHVHDWEQTVRTMEEHLNPAAWHIVDHSLYRAMERSVDAIARAWAETLPLPPENAQKEVDP